MTERHDDPFPDDPGDPGAEGGGPPGGAWYSPRGWDPDPGLDPGWPPQPVGHRRPRRAHGRVFWVLLTGAAALLAAGAAELAVPGHVSRPAAQPSAAQPSAARSASPAAVPAPPPAITAAAARQVLAGYLTAFAAAGRARSDMLLGQAAAGSSYRLAAGSYRYLDAADPGGGYDPETFTAAAWYIPRLAGYPRWFAAEGTWSGGAARTAAYLVFAQASPAARWLDVLGPAVTAPARPPIAAAGGSAAAAPDRPAAGLAAAPASLPAATAAVLDGTGTSVTLAGLGRQADQLTQAYWQPRLPRGSGDTDRHSPGPGGVYALRTAGGGALVFYSLSATLTITPPPGGQLRLAILGYYSPAAPVTGPAVVPWTEQFAAWIPPGPGPARVQVIAQSSGLAAG